MCISHTEALISCDGAGAESHAIRTCVCVLSCVYTLRKAFEAV